MMRRIFFLLPGKQHIKHVVDDLQIQGVERTHMRVISKQQKDRVYNMEKLFWSGNIALFFIALITTFALALYGLYSYMIPTLAIMIACLTIGAFFIVKIPNTHVSEFKSALKHGKVLLVVNVKKQQVNSIEKSICSRHPEVITGGVGWTIEAL